MGDKINLVAGDTRPQLVFSITDEATKQPINLAGASVAFKFRRFGAKEIKATMPCGLLAGRLNEDGSIDYSGVSATPGASGRAFMDWSPTALDAEGDYQGEIEITFPDGGVQTVFESLRFKVRAQY